MLQLCVHALGAPPGLIGTRARTCVLRFHHVRTGVRCTSPGAAPQTSLPRARAPVPTAIYLQAGQNKGPENGGREEDVDNQACAALLAPAPAFGALLGPPAPQLSAPRMATS